MTGYLAIAAVFAGIVAHCKWLDCLVVLGRNLRETVRDREDAVLVERFNFVWIQVMAVFGYGLPVYLAYLIMGLWNA